MNHTRKNECERVRFFSADARLISSAHALLASLQFTKKDENATAFERWGVPSTTLEA